MKKIYVMLLILLGFSFLTSCQLDKDILLGNKEPHEHVLVPEWTQNDKYHWHACSGCDKIVEKEEHDFGSWVEVKEATEYEVGEEKRECICGFTETRKIEKLDHTHKPTGEYGHNDKYHWETCSECDAQLNKKSHTGGVATCQEKATCTICNVQYGSLSNKHVYGEYEVISEATCKERAIEEATCTVDGCQAKDTRYVPGSTTVGHKWGEWTYIEGSATCLKDGMEERGCLTCSSKEKRSAEGTKLAHHASSEVLFDGNSHWNSCDVTKGCTEKLNVVAHSYDDDCDEVCNGCSYEREAEHNYSNACDKTCNDCGVERYTPDHTGGVATCLLPGICTECGVPYILPLPHEYHNACDATCNLCGNVTRVPAPHTGGTATCLDQAICAECGVAYGELAAHTYGEWVEEVAATCEEPGTKGHQYCSVCEKNYDEHGNVIVSLVINAKGHKLGDLVIEVEPTCTEAGKKAHYQCLTCSELFDANKVKVDELDLVIPAKGHNLTYNALVPATCENVGKLAHYHCSTCGKDYEDNEATTELTNLVIEALGHDYGQWVPAKEATCEEDGNIGHFNCSGCGKYFDINRDELIPEEVVIAKTGHAYGTDLIEKDATSHGKKCDNCGEVDPTTLANHNFNIDEPTIEHAKQCVDCGYVAAPALNHTEHIGGVATCTSKAVCTGCGEEYGDFDSNNHSSDECAYVVVDATSHKKIHSCCNVAVTEEHDVIQEATCITQAICENCGSFGELKEHTYDEEHKVVTDPTCLEDGYVTYTCTTNGCNNTKVVAGEEAPGHTVVTDEEVTATCTSIGLTEGSHCSVCGEVLVKQEVVPMKQHSVDENGTKATCLYPAICGLCNQYFDDKDPSNHVNELIYKDNGDGTHTAIYTCCDTSVENSTSEHTGGTQSCHSLMTCTSCGAMYGELLSHNYQGTTTNPSISATGIVTYACSNDGCKEKLEIILPLIGEKYSEDVLIEEKLEYQYKLNAETINLLVANLSVKHDLAEYLEGLTFTYLPTDVNKTGYFMVVDGVLVENANEFTADLAVDNNVVIYDANGSKLQYNLVNSNESNDGNTINVYVNHTWDNIGEVWVNDVKAEKCYSPYGNYVAKLSEASNKLDVDFLQGSAWFHIETKDSSKRNNADCYIDYQLELGKNYQITDINYKYETNSSQKFFYATINNVENYSTNSYSIREIGEHNFTVNSNNQIDVTAPTITIYLNTGGSSYWNQADAWFAAWIYPNPADKLWVKLVETSEEGIYSAEIPTTATNIRFFRMSNTGTEFTWMQNGTGWWNQTIDLEIAGNNKIYNITGWDSTAGNWSDYHICVSNGVYDFDENLHWTNCSICGNKMNEIAHTNEATCTEGDTCACGKEFAALGHAPEVVDAKAPTCTEVGWDAYVTCSRCDYTTYNEIPATGHTVVVDEAVAPDCETTGKTVGSHCSKCLIVFIEQEEVPATGHKYEYKYYDNAEDEITSGSSISCSQDLVCKGICSNNNAHTTETTIKGEELLGNDLGILIEHNNIVAATCLTGSYCENCGDPISGIDSDAHSYGSYSSDNNATCTTDGTKTKTCSLCGDKYTMKDSDSKTGHSYGAWSVSLAPTVTTNGFAVRECENDNCDALETFIIDNLTKENYYSETPSITETVYTFNGVMPEGFTASKNGYYNDGGYKFDAINQYILTNIFEAQNSVKVILNIGKLNSKTNTSDVTNDDFIIYGLNANDEVVGSGMAIQITGTGEHSVIINGENIVRIKIVMNDFPYVSEKCNNVNLTSVTLGLIETNYICINPTCTATGLETYIISIDGQSVATYEVVLPATGHNWTNWEKEYDENDEETGNLIRCCQNDGCEEIEIKDNDHECSYGAWEWESEARPTNATTANIIRTCDIDGCDNKEIKVLPVLNLVDYLYVVTIESTCTVEGKAIYTYIENETSKAFRIEVDLPKLNHTYGLWNEETSATCTATGIKGYYYCTSCERNYDDNDEEILNLVIPALGHSYGEVVPQVDATCTETGTKAYYKCSVCSECFNTEKELVEASTLVISATGHSYGEVVPQVDATCTETGTKAYYKCSVCSEYFNTEKELVEESTLVISATGHSYGELVAQVDATCTETGKESHYKCSVCSKYFNTEKELVEESTLVISALGHNYGELVAQVDATCTETGTKAHYKCSVCSKYFNAEKELVEASTLVISVDLDNHTSTEFTYEVNTDDSAKHDKKYQCCDEVVETVAHEFVIVEDVVGSANGSYKKACICGEDDGNEYLDVYLTPNNYWIQGGSRYAVYVYDDANGNGDYWEDMVGTGSGTYKATIIVSNYTHLIFCRMNPSAKDNNWGNKWNQTADLAIPTSTNTSYVVKSNTWDNGGGSWQNPTTQKVMHLKPNTNWTSDSAWFAAAFLNASKSVTTWANMIDSNGDDIYECIVPTDTEYKYVIFCRMNPSTDNNNWELAWSDKWNQTADLAIPTNGNNLFTVPSGAWDGSTTSWSKK